MSNPPGMLSYALKPKPKGTLFGKPRSEVVKHPGAESAAAKRAGKSTHAYAESKKNAPGIAGKRARLALIFEKMRAAK